MGDSRPVLIAKSLERVYSNNNNNHSSMRQGLLNHYT